jgi:hypothetical protein
MLRLICRFSKYSKMSKYQNEPIGRLIGMTNPNEALLWYTR